MKRSKVIVDGLGLVDGHFSGVGQYILGILRGIDEEIEDLKYKGLPYPEVKVVVPWDMVDKFKSFSFVHIDYKRFPLSFRVMSKLWYSGKMPPIDLWCGRGFYIFPRFVDMPLLFSKSAIVIFDLSYELYREYSDEGNAEFLSKRVRDSISRTSKVITISDNAKREILDFYRLKNKQVVVATPAADQKVFYRRSQPEIDEAKKKYGITQDYILALSNLEPRKNLKALVDAYCKLPKDITDKTALLLVGVSGWKTDNLFEHIIGKVNEGYNIVRPSSYVLDEDKAAIISGAKMLVYPSHYEGFGMPPLEAMACGVPVIAANNSSLPQVMGKAGRMVSSKNDKALLDAIESYFKDYDAVLSRARVEGPAQAQKFNWLNSGRVFLQVAEEVCK